MKFKDVIEQFFDYKKDYVRKTTLSNYFEILYNHLVPYFGEMTEINEEDISNYLDFMCQKDQAKKTLESHIACLKSVLSWGNKKGIFKSGKFKANYPTTARQTAEINPLTIEAAKKLSSYCEDNINFMNLIILTALYTGMRNGELCALQWKDFDIQKGVVNVSKTIVREVDKKFGQRRGVSKVTTSPPKTAESIREIPLAPILIKFYKVFEKITKPENFVSSNKSSPNEPASLTLHLKKCLISCEIPQIRMHDLRHTFATRCINSGIDAKTVSALLGHSSVITTLKTYTHTNDEEKTNAINKLFNKIKR